MNSYTDNIWEAYIAETSYKDDKSDALGPDEELQDDGSVKNTKTGKIVHVPKKKKQADKKTDELEENNQLLAIASELLDSLQKDAKNGFPSKESKALVSQVYKAEPDMFDPDTIRKFAQKAGMDDFEIEYILPREFQKEFEDGPVGNMGYSLGDFMPDAGEDEDEDDIEWEYEGDPDSDPLDDLDKLRDEQDPELIEDQQPAPFRFESDHNPLISRYLDHVTGDNSVGFSFIGSDDTYYYGEAEFDWDGGFYTAKYSGTSAAEEPDEEPEVADIQVVHVINQETDQEVDEATYNAVQSWIESELEGMGWSMMIQMGWEEPEPDYDPPEDYDF